MQTTETHLINRPDTFFGVCEGLGQDLRIHPNLFRIALAGLLFWNPLAAFGAYAGLGMIVLLSRLVFPNPAIPAPAEPSFEQAPAAEQADDRERLPLAA